MRLRPARVAAPPRTRSRSPPISGPEGRNAGSRAGPEAPGRTGAAGGSAAEPSERRSSRRQRPITRWSPPAESYFYRRAQQLASESTPDPTSGDHGYSTRLRGAVAPTMPSRESHPLATSSGPTPPRDGRAAGHRSLRSTRDAEPVEGGDADAQDPGRPLARRLHLAAATPEPPAQLGIDSSIVAEAPGRVSRRSQRSGPEGAAAASAGPSPVLAAAEEQKTPAGRRGRRGSCNLEGSVPPAQSEGVRGTSPKPHANESRPRLSLRINLRRAQEGAGEENAPAEAAPPARTHRRGREGQDATHRGTGSVAEPEPVPAPAETRRSQRVPVPSHRVVSLSSLVESDGAGPAPASGARVRASGIVVRLPTR